MAMVPLAVAAAAAATIAAARPGLMLSGRVALWLLVLEVGAALSLGMAGASWLRARAARDAARLTSAADIAQAQQDHRRFIARLDHELKNPITAIRVGITNLRATIDPGHGDPRGDLLANLDAQAVRLARLTGDLRKLTAVEIAPLDESLIEPSELLHDVVDDARDLDPSHRGSVGVELALPHRPWPLPSIVGDRDLLHLALLNLVTNAVKFSRPGGTVEVRAQDEPTTGQPRWLIVEVADTGIGVAPDELPIVWSELARAGVPSDYRVPASGCPWCVRSSRGTAARSCCAVSKARARSSPSGCPFISHQVPGSVHRYLICDTPDTCVAVDLPEAGHAAGTIARHATRRTDERHRSGRHGRSSARGGPPNRVPHLGCGVARRHDRLQREPDEQVPVNRGHPRELARRQEQPGYRGHPGHLVADPGRP